MVVLACLCWNNLDPEILTMLIGQIQVKVLILLVTWAMVCYTIYHVQCCSWHPVSAAFMSIVWFNPLLCILLLDAMRKMSRPFRIALPLAYVMFASQALFYYAFVPGKPIYIFDTHSAVSGGVLYYISEATAQGQLTNTLTSILTLMLRFLLTALLFPDGSAICFPIALKTKKDAVDFVLQLKSVIDTTTMLRFAQRASSSTAVEEGIDPNVELVELSLD